MSDYSIRIPARGEEIEYTEGTERYLFETSFSSVPYRLYARQFWTYPLPTGPLQLPKEKRYIAERVAKWMSSDGNPTVLVWEEEAYRHPLKSVDQLLAERLASRRPIS
jgi:hypothetical protein